MAVEWQDCIKMVDDEYPVNQNSTTLCSQHVAYDLHVYIKNTAYSKLKCKVTQVKVHGFPISDLY